MKTAEPSDGDSAIGIADQPDLLNLLFKHRMDVIRDFLRGKSVAFSGTRSKLRQRVESYLNDGSVSGEELVDLLNTVEGWGNQHAYLYRSPAPLIERWNTEGKARAVLRTNRIEEVFNCRFPLILPANPKLCAIEWTPRGVRFLWVERREWRERVPDEDYTEEDIEYTAHRVHRTRGLIAFDWDLVSGHAALLIQRLPSGENYREAKVRFEALLEPLVKVSKFQPVYISPSILALEKSGEVRHRQLEHATERGAKITFLSRSRTVGAFDDPALKKARDALGDKLDGCHGNFYMRMPDDHQREVHIKLYAKDQRLGVFGECQEAEIRHVLSRVRHHCG